MLKLNTNAAYYHITARAGYGCVTRDDHGHVIAFSCGRYEGAPALATSRGLSIDCFECDVVNVIF